MTGKTVNNVVHKFVLETRRITRLRLEPGAVVLYAGLDTRTSQPALWVLRSDDGTGLDRMVATAGDDRYFGVYMTGEAFELPVVPRPRHELGPRVPGGLPHRRTHAWPWGLVRVPDGLEPGSDFVWHVFEFVRTHEEAHAPSGG